LRGGIKKVLIPEENAKDLADIPETVKNGLEIVPVARMEEVLEHALTAKPQPIEWSGDEVAADSPAGEEADATGTIVAH
jgi:ATP-dependent Lon protease